MAKIQFSFEYAWEPFEVERRHLTFKQHKSARLSRYKCSHWGAAIYKWEGVLQEEPNAGKIGILIGETKDLRQRIKQYISGTQKSGNVFWRENFLERGDIYLYILKLQTVHFIADAIRQKKLDIQDLSSGNVRVVYEQLLVMSEVAKKQQNVWIVNRKL
ncbi:MAG: hypothetical protein B6243_05265 [Anaerolineaceae bacterium 4572_5.2]|nr:MAG: hypothetical protein B6243_05265 [Anaerolineaceae bacterium 4572_5.2]